MTGVSFSTRVGWVLRNSFRAGESRLDLGPRPAIQSPHGIARPAAAFAEAAVEVTGGGAGGGPAVDQKTLSQNFKLIFVGLLAVLILVLIFAFVLQLEKAGASNAWTLATTVAGGLIGLVVGKAAN